MRRIVSLSGFVLAMALFCIVALFPIHAQAVTYKKYNDGSVFRLKRNSSLLYKYTLTEDSLVEIDYAYNTYGNACFIIMDSNLSGVWSYYADNESGKQFVVLNAGTYILDFYESSPDNASYTATTKFKIISTPASSINKDNYCREKTITIEARKWVKIVQTNGSEYTRWYQIVVPETRKVSIDLPAGNMSDINIFNINNMKKYDMEFGGKTLKSYRTKNRLSKGRYFVLVHPYNISTYTYEGKPGTGIFYQFRWY